jgi:anti-sigma regulatory factor (Ser/Thr protein kinase)
MTETTIQRAEQRYTPDATAPRRARAFVDEFLETVGAADLDEQADLLTSELVADAVRHAPSQVVVRVTFDRTGLRVEISDDPGLVTNPEAGKVERELSRKHAEALASRWGSSFTRDITTTWFELEAA